MYLGPDGRPREMWEPPSSVAAGGRPQTACSGPKGVPAAGQALAAAGLRGYFSAWASNGACPAASSLRDRTSEGRRPMRFMALTVTLVLVVVASARGQPLTSAFSYQGELRQSGSPAAGPVDLRFQL